MKYCLLLFTSLLLLSCSKDDSSIITPSISENDVLGKWEVVHVEQASGDATENLNGFVFEFKGANELVITNETFSIIGTWKVMAVNKGLQLFVPTKEEPLRMFHNNWNVNSSSNGIISLSGASNQANGNMEYINFQKI